MGRIAEHKQTIDGIEYTTKTFPATVGLTLMARLARLVVVESWEKLLGLDLDGLAAILRGGEDAAEAATVEAGLVFLDGFISAAKAAEPEEFAALCKALLAETHCARIADTDGAAGPVAQHFDVHFAGRYLHLGKVVLWVAHKGFTGP